MYMYHVYMYTYTHRHPCTVCGLHTGKGSAHTACPLSRSGCAPGQTFTHAPPCTHFIHTGLAAVPSSHTHTHRCAWLLHHHTCAHSHTHTHTRVPGCYIMITHAHTHTHRCLATTTSSRSRWTWARSCQSSPALEPRAGGRSTTAWRRSTLMSTRCVRAAGAWEYEGVCPLAPATSWHPCKSRGLCATVRLILKFSGCPEVQCSLVNLHLMAAHY